MSSDRVYQAFLSPMLQGRLVKFVMGNAGSGCDCESCSEADAIVAQLKAEEAAGQAELMVQEPIDDVEPMPMPDVKQMN